MRRKRRPSAPELRAELAGLPRYMAGVAERLGAADVAAGFRRWVAAIEAGEEIRLRGMDLPDWLAPGVSPGSLANLGH
jgi:hypothetical protein